MAYFIYNKRKVFYTDEGSGKALLIIHGNSVSSRMHSKLAKNLSREFRVISPDLPGHGKSERLDEWPVDFWFEHSKAVCSLLHHLDIESAVLLGYSGGAQIALNTALEDPGLVSKVIADSFEGEYSVASYAENILEVREKDKKKLLAKAFWFYMHGYDWKKVVDNDSRVIYGHHRNIGSFFHRNLSEIKVPVFLTGSFYDEYIDDFEKYYKPLMDKLPLARKKIYRSGKHPALLTVGEEFIKDLIDFINNDKLHQG